MKFEDDSGGMLTFHIETTPDSQEGGEGVPIKLGDGNFGCVFAAKGGHRLLAVKVIYEHQAGGDAQSASDELDYKKMRVQEELRITGTIFNGLNESSDEKIRKLAMTYHQHLALPLAYSTNLDEDEEFKKYASMYERHDLKFSKYAYVMDRFDCSLKDLMEHGGRISSCGQETKQTAYARLKSSPLPERERSALAVLSQVASGLHVLHAVGLRHQDIKPANIYYRDNQGKVQFVLGDLGFLRPLNPAVAGSALISPDALVIGTKHYRSVEQIDHSDLSEVSVEPGPDGRTATLVSRDPKFQHTNIRQGDQGVFSRSSSRILFDIQEFEKIRDRRGGETSQQVPMEIKEVRMKIKTADQPQSGGGERKAQGLLSLNDGPTQVSFIKQPTEKTDLFGLGAVLFDVITAGDSAERFYELLRKFDVEGDEIGQKILNHYPTWRSGQIVPPELSAIFHRVNGDGKSYPYLHPGVLDFLLKCMMSEASDSFFMTCFGTSGRRGDPPGWPEVTGSIESLVRGLDAQDYGDVDRNVLTAAGESKPPSGESSSLPRGWQPIKELLFELQGNAPIDRWRRTASFLNAMMELSRRLHAKIRSDNDTAFVSMAPEHLILSRDDHIIKESDVVGSYTDSEYLNQLMALHPLFSSIMSEPNPFLPIWWPSRMRRVSIRLWSDVENAASTDEGEGGTGGVIRVATKSAGPTTPGQDPKEGDFLVISNEKSTYSLYDVEKVGEGHLEIRRNCKVGRENNPVGFRPDERRSGYLVKAFDDCTYCGGMLAVYLFHALFAAADGRRNGVEHFGREVISRSHYFPMGNLPKPSKGFGGRGSGWLSRRRDPATEHRELLRYSIRLYVWLMLGGFAHGESPEDQMGLIREEVSQWKDQVADSLETPRSNMDDLIFQWTTDAEPNDDSDARYLQMDEAMWERVAIEYIGARKRK